MAFDSTKAIVSSLEDNEWPVVFLSSFDRAIIQDWMNCLGILQPESLTILTCTQPPDLLADMSSFQQLIDIVKKLRGPQGCPWDKAQTHKSLTPYAVEEAHELEEAIENEDLENTKEELGDLLFQSVLHAEIARQNGDFDINDVIDHLNHKMTTRHPHVFSNMEVSDSDEVVKNWEEIKAQEKTSDIFDIPKSFPSLLRAHKIGKRTKKMDFDWTTPQEVLLKIKEELAELEEAIKEQDKNHMEEELGDLLFSCAQLARHLDLDGEKALRQANRKFIKRFQEMLNLDPQFESLSRADKEKLWQKVKNQNR